VRGWGPVPSLTQDSCAGFSGSKHQEVGQGEESTWEVSTWGLLGLKAYTGEASVQRSLGLRAYNTNATQA
jgi:hypothetical protein